jgi:dihydrofolate reductase
MNAIVCMNSKKGIGYRGQIPWRSRVDTKYFKERTVGKGNNAIIMGFKTFASLNYRPLPNRRNYVLTRHAENASMKIGGDVVFESCIDNLILLPCIFDEVYVIGGEEIYKIFEPLYIKIYVTIIDNSHFCDTFFSIDLQKYKKTILYQTLDNLQQLTFCEYEKIREETQEVETVTV